MHALVSGKARMAAPARSLLARAGGVFMWPGIALTERRGAACVLVAADVARFWITRLHGAVTGNPAAGQYAVVNGTYNFAQPDAGSTVLLTYGYVPADLASCCMDWAAERYAYRSRIGQHSKSLGGQETMAFIVKDIPDFVVSALSPYRRVVMP
jgi:hypothetical protein